MAQELGRGQDLRCWKWKRDFVQQDLSVMKQAATDLMIISYTCAKMSNKIPVLN
jgi:hypothetical protein